jgi:hypothetical protein
VNDIQFFDTILPSTGLRCIALVKPSGAWHHLWGDTNAWLAKISKQIDTSKNIDVYYGCSSFTVRARDVAPKDGGGRKQINVAFVRSFWVDLDVGESEPGKPPKYATQKLAARAILKFALDHGLPQPWLVSSGWGVHAYWPTDADMPVSVWKPVAEALKRALRASGVLFDPSRTADEASVLRPPGTHNHKRQPRPIKIVAVGAISPLASIAGPMAAFVQAAASPSIATAQLSSMNAALGGGMGPEPSSALLMADHCAIMGMMRDTRGNLDQPTWYYSLGVLLHTDEAPAICHEWSDGHPDYSVAETNANLARLATHGATTCAKLAEYQPAACAACPFNGKITSPIQLGREKAHPATVETVERVVDKKGFATEKVVKRDLPFGYGETVHGGRRVLTHTVMVDDKDGKPQAKTVTVANTHFWGVTRMWDEGKSLYEFEMVTREGTRKFLIEGGAIGGGGRELSVALAENEIVARRGQKDQLHSYMSAWMENLTSTSDQVRAHRAFGWFEDTFVLGDTVIKPDGTENRAILRGIADSKRDSVVRKGSLKTWVALVDRAYNAPGQEGFQFQMACAFAAPLISLMQQVKGVTVYSHSDGSGVGKTTVQQVGLSAWGCWDDMMLAQGKATGNALWGLLGAYNSLPIVYDELTNVPVAEVSELVFSVSSGRAKERMNAHGEIRTNNNNWSTILLASGNTLLSEKLAQHRANAEAEISRLFEFTLEAPPHLSVVEANALFPQFREHYGHAGHRFARYVTMNRAKITKALNGMQQQLHAEFDLKQVERHWSALFACVVMALLICRGLGLLAFEVDPIKLWMRDQLDENRGGRDEAVVPMEDLINEMVTELFVDVLVTQGTGDLRAGIAVATLKAPRSSIVGRSIRAHGSEPADLRISRVAIHAWCAKRSISPTAMHAAGVAAGLVHPKVDRFSLGRGVKEQQVGNVHAWRFFPDALDLPDVELAPPLTLVAGGKP